MDAVIAAVGARNIEFEIVIVVFAIILFPTLLNLEWRWRGHRSAGDGSGCGCT